MMFHSLLSDQGYTSEYRAILNEVRTAGQPVPTPFQSFILNQYLGELITYSIWPQIAKMWVFMGGDSQDYIKSVEWKNPPGPKAVFSGTHTLNKFGFNPDGTSGKVQFRFNPFVDGGAQFDQNDACVVTHSFSYNGQADKADFGVRNAAGTAQVMGVRRSSSVPNATRVIMNDNTNSDMASAVTTRGVVIWERRDNANKGIIRRAVDSGSLPVASVALVNGDVYGGCRNSLNTASFDLFCANNISIAIFCAELTSDQKTTLQNIIVRMALNLQATKYISRTVLPVVNPRGKVFGIGGSGQWDEGSVFGQAWMTLQDGTRRILYGGTDEGGADPTNYAIGAFDFTGNSYINGTKNVGNPLLTPAGVGLDSYYPMDAILVGTTWYIFITVRNNTTINLDTYCVTCQVGDEDNLTTPLLILNGGAGPQRFNHGFRIVRNHPDPDYYYAIYAHKAIASDPIVFNVVRALKVSNLSLAASWSSWATDICAIPPNFSGTLPGLVYNFCWWTGTTFKLWFGRFNAEIKADYFAINAAESADLSDFDYGEEWLSPINSLSADPNESVDSGYVSSPFSDVNDWPNWDPSDGYVYFAARAGGASSSYIAYCVKKFLKK